MFLRNLLCLKWNSRTVRKSIYWKLIQIAPIFVKHYGYSLRGVILEPLRPLEKNFGPPQAFIKTVLVAKINLLLNPYTILGQRRFIIGAQKPIKAHWRNLWDMWYVKLCFKEFSSGFGYPEGT